MCCLCVYMACVVRLCGICVYMVCTYMVNACDVYLCGNCGVCVCVCVCGLARGPAPALPPFWMQVLAWLVAAGPGAGALG